MTRITTHDARAGCGTSDACTLLCGASVCPIAQDDDPMNLRSRAARAGGDS